MSDITKVVTILGTRPEIVKLSPLLPLLNEHFEHVLIHTGQHYDYEMDQVFFEQLQLKNPTYNLNIGSGLQGKQTALMLEKIEKILLSEKPQLVIVQGDTNSVLAGALAAVKLNIPVAHVEAGLRNFRKDTPEEVNRIVADHVADYLFAPDGVAVQNLRKEGFSSDKIYFVGSTSYEAALRNSNLGESTELFNKLGIEKNKYILVTIHRAENTNDSVVLGQIVGALNVLATKTKLVFPIHPRTKKKIEEFGLVLDRSIIALPPQEYLSLLQLLKFACFCITESGGIQEESVVFNTPCIIPLNETCWPKLVTAGKNFLVGQTTQSIVQKAEELLNDNSLKEVKNIVYTYPINVAQQIVDILKLEKNRNR